MTRNTNAISNSPFVRDLDKQAMKQSVLVSVAPKTWSILSNLLPDKRFRQGDEDEEKEVDYRNDSNAGAKLHRKEHGFI